MTRRRLILLAATAALAAPLAVPSYAAPGAWTPTLPATGGFDHLSMFPNGVAYAETVGGYAKSTDFGLTWTPRAIPSGQVELGLPHNSAGGHLRFATPTIGYVYTFGEPFSDGKCAGGGTTRFARTADGGTTWTPVCLPKQLDSPSGFSMAASPIVVARDGRTVMILGGEEITPDDDCDVRRGVVYSSTDAGAHWTRTLLAHNTSPGWAAAAYDGKVAAILAYHYVPQGDDCSFLGDSNSVVMTRDGGRTWKPVHRCLRGEAICTGVGFAGSPNRIFVGRSDGSMQYSHDGGKRWRWGQSLVDPRYQEAISRHPEMARWFWIQGFSFADARTGYASTRGAGTWRTADGGQTWKQERSHECEYHPYGVGEISTATPDRALTGGPRWIGPRQPTPADAGPCAPAEGQLPAPRVVDSGSLRLSPDATVTPRRYS